jgi:hypothetical protein
MRFYDVPVNRSVPTEANRGLTSYTRNGDMDFVIACEQQSKVEVDGYQVKNSIVREVHIPRPSRCAKM